jgi:beta-barrel assembly-enhancing protease
MDDRPRSPISGRLLIAVIIAVISLLTYFGSSTYNPITGKKQHVGSITAEQEIQLGLQAAPEMTQQYGGLERDPGTVALVDQVGIRIIQNSDVRDSPYRFKFHVLADEKTINAFALPGGQIFITDGLLNKLKTPGQLAGVLAHEIGHVVDRHGAQHIAKQQLTQGLGSAAVIAASDPNDPNSSRSNAQLAQLVTQLVNLKFGRGDELEADRLGVRYMAQAGYDPRAMLQVMEILREASAGRAPPEFFSTHPDPGNREEHIQKEIDREFTPGELDRFEK